MNIKSSLYKFRFLAMVFLFAIISLHGVAQVYRYTSPSSSIITNSDGNAINVPTDIPNSNTKHLVYLRSLKTVKNSSLFYFKELFQPVVGNFESQTYSRINDHYFILLDSNEISSFKYSFYYGNSTSSYCFGQDFTSNFFYPGEIEYREKLYATNCSKNEIPENTRATILTNELFCGIAPEKPSCLTIKGQSNSGTWVQASMITEGQRVALSAEGYSSEFIYEYSWYETDDVTTIPESEWELVTETDAKSFEFTIPHVPDIYTNIPKTLWFRTFSIENNETAIGKSFGYAPGSINVYRKPQFEVDTVQNFCFGGAGVNSIAISNLQFPSTGLNRIDFTIKLGTEIVPYWSKEFTTSGNFTLSHSGGLSNFLSPDNYTLIAENVWLINGVKFAAGDTTMLLKVISYPRLDTLLVDNISRPCPISQTINILKDTTLINDFNLEYAYSSSAVFQTAVNGKVPLSHNTDSLILRISSKDYDCPEVKKIKVTSTYPYFTFTPSHTQSCPDQPAYIRPNITDWAAISPELRAIMYFSVDDLKGFTHVSGSIPVTTDGEKVVTVGFLVNGVLLCPKSILYEFSKLPLINFDLASTPVRGCNSALNGSIIISNIKNVVATVDQPCKIKLRRYTEVTYTDSIELTSIPEINSYTFSKLAAGKYVVKLIDGKGCTKTAFITLSLNDVPFSITYSWHDPEPCSYSTNGSVIFVASGSGSPNFQVSKDNLTWQTSNTLSNFSGGTYTVYARPTTLLGVGIDECKVPLEVTFKAPNPVEIEADITQPTCSNSMGSVTFNGASSYEKFNGSIYVPVSNPLNLIPGDYQFRGKKTTKGTTGCYSDPISVTIDSIPQISITNFTQANPSCFGGDGSISFKIAQQLPAGQYTIILNKKEVRNCSDIIIDESKCYTLIKGVYTIGNLPAGSYTLEITQGTECSDTESFTITQPNKLQINLIPPVNGYPIQCNGGTTNFEIGIVGGVIDETGYTLEHNIDITNNGSPIIGLPEDIFPYAFNNIKTGFYHLAATDENGCLVERIIEIDEPEPLLISVDSITIPTCSGSNDGSIYLNVGGGVLPYTINYTLDNVNVFAETITSGNTYQIDSLSYGVWLYNLVDKNNCKNPITFDYYNDTLATPVPMELLFLNVTNPKCYNDSTGSFGIVAFGKENEEKIFELWRNGALISSTITNSDTLLYDSLAYGDYKVIFKFGSECSTYSETTLTHPDSLTYTISAINNSCFESNNGSVTVNVSGGTMPYLIELFKNGELVKDTLFSLSSCKFSNLTVGNYSIQLADTIGCPVYILGDTVVTVSNPEAPIGLSLKQFPVICYETATGIIEAKASGGWGNYEYSIDNGVNWIANDTVHFTGLVDSTYNIQLKDLMGCEISQTIEVTQPNVLAIDSVVVYSVSCYGGSNGSVYLTAMGGNGGYTWSFSNGTEVLPDSIIHNLTSNCYKYSVKDFRGCTVSDSIFVPQPEAFSIEFFTNSYDGFNIKCNGGTDSLRYSVAGGNTPYSTLLNGTNAGIASSGDTLVYTNLTKGKYVLSLTDRKGCFYSDSTVLIEPVALKIDSVIYTEPRCHGGNDGKIEVKVINGISPYIYKLEFDAETSWQNTSGIFTGLVADTFQLSVTDKYGCEIGSQLILEQPDPVTLTIEEINPIACKGDRTGYAEVSGVGGVGGYSFTWYNSNDEIVSNINSISEVSADNYLVNVWDGNGCNIAGQFPIQIPEPANFLDVDSLRLTQPNCFGESNGEIFIAATGGWGEFTYTLDGISNSEGGFNGLLANTLGYKIFISDLLNCKIDTTIILNQPDSLQLMLILIQHVTCNGDSTGLIKVEAVGGNAGYDYNINDLNNTTSTTGEFNALAAGGYTIFVNDSKGCAASLSDTITQPTAITYASADIIRPTCQNANGAITINSPSGGTGSISIAWDEPVTDTGFVVDSLRAGNYKFFLTDEADCTREFVVTLSDIDGPKIDSFIITNPTCSYRNDGAIQLTLSGDAAPFNVTWSGNGTWESDSSTYINILGGNYSVQVVDSNYCKTISDFIVNAPYPVLVSVENTSVSCIGDSNGKLKAEISGGTGTYLGGWYVNENLMGFSVANLPAGSYNLSVADSNGCGVGNSDVVEVGSYYVMEPELPLQFTQLLSQPKCFGNQNGAISINDATGGWGQYKYSLNGGEAQLNPIFSNLSAGKYSISVSDKGGCSVHKTVTLGQPNQLDLQLVSTDSVNCFGQSNGQIKVNAIGGTTPYSYSNQSGFNGHGNFFNLPSANYRLYVNDKNNCSDSIDVFVSQPELLEVSISSILPAHCGTSDGEIQLTAQGGNGLYRAIWTGFESVSSLTLGRIPSGNYGATVVDQKNCISNQVSGEVPEIAGPMLVIDSIASPLCSYSSDGSIQFSTQNGSTPFDYFVNNQWFQNEKVENISGGIYQLRVVDKFGCIDTVTVEVVAPQELAINVIEETSPRCHNFSDGKISISSAGGTLPHGYKWSNDFNGSTISALSSGSYTVTLTDNNNCTKQESYVLRNPAPIVVNLPELVTLCAGQTSQFDASNEGSMYWWTSTNNFESFERQIEVSETGSYYLQITNPAGCFAYDTVNVTKHNYEVDATFIIPSEAYVGDTIVAIDISWPIPDSLYWVIPSEFEIVESYQYEYILKPKQEGNYSIGIVSYVGECSAYQQKSISVLPQQAAPLLPKEGLTDIFVSASVAPNPAVNSTLLSVELSRIANLSISINNAFGQKLKALSVLNGNSYRINIPVTAFTKGVYMIVLTAETSTRTIKLVVN